jgi:hypothetical protein
MLNVLNKPFESTFVIIEEVCRPADVKWPGAPICRDHLALCQMRCEGAIGGQLLFCRPFPLPTCSNNRDGDRTMRKLLTFRRR